MFCFQLEEELVELMILALGDLAWMALGVDEEVGFGGGEGKGWHPPTLVYMLQPHGCLVQLLELFSLCKVLLASELFGGKATWWAELGEQSCVWWIL